MGRSARGVKGIDLDKGDVVVAALTPRRDADLVAATGRGFGKRIPFTEFRLQGRAGKGTGILPERDRAGDLVGLVEVLPDDRVMWELSDGELVATAASQVLTRARREASRRVVEPADGVAVEAVHPVRSAPERTGHRAAETAPSPGKGSKQPSAAGDRDVPLPATSPSGERGADSRRSAGAISPSAGGGGNGRSPGSDGEEGEQAELGLE